MQDENVQKAISELIQVYGSAVKCRKEGQETHILIPNVELYPGCIPFSTQVLLVFRPSEPKPAVYVTPGQLLSNGIVPRSSSTVLLYGESWMQFSFNIPWTEGENIMRFFGGARRRFSLND